MGKDERRNRQWQDPRRTAGHFSRLAPVQDHAQERGVEKRFHWQRLACGNR